MQHISQKQLPSTKSGYVKNRESNERLRYIEDPEIINGIDDRELVALCYAGFSYVISVVSI